MMTILILLYLSISIGHKKGVEGISTTDFDKIPLEIILGIGVAIFAIIMLMTFGGTTPSDISLEVSLIVTAYFSIYIVIAIIFDTFVRRLKAKTFWKSTIIGKIFKQLVKIFSKLEKFFKELRGTSKFFDKTTKKFILDCVIAIVFAIIILLIFHEDLVFTAVLETVIVVIFVFRLLKAIADYDKIEEKLKEMYEGNNNDALERKEFLPEFYQSVDYINDISNGFERAIQDRIKSERLKTELITNVSHDLRTPLTSISGNACNLCNHYEMLDNETRKQIFSDIYDDSEWLIQLVENLLSVTRIENGEMKLNQSIEIMDDVIDEALKHIDRNKVEHDIEVCRPEELIIANIDAKLIMQVVINIVNNAIKYTQAGSIIKIAYGNKNDMVYVNISDNGPGMDDTIKEHVFDMFYTGQNKIADSKRSMGLGLALCKSVVEAHGGSIEVKDNIPFGCIFTFYLKKGEVIINE